MISQRPWYALAAPSKQAVRTSVVCVGSRPVLLPPWLGHGGTRSILTTGQIGVVASRATLSVGHSVRCPICAHASRVQAQRWRSSTCPVSITDTEHDDILVDLKATRGTHRRERVTRPGKLYCLFLQGLAYPLISETFP